MATGTRIRRPLFIFMAILLVFMLTQVGVERVFLVVQEKASKIISQSIQLSGNNTVPIFTVTTGFPILPPPTGPPNATADRLTDGQIFIRSAFRVSDSEIRLSVLKDHKNHRAIFYEYGTKAGQLSLRCNLPKCLEMFAPKCKVVGYIGQIFELNATDNHEWLRLRFDKSDRFVTMPVIDVRPKNYTHQLGVCVQPIYMTGEFIVFIQFFEHWLARGATKFYIYRHSYSKEVQLVLDFYAEHSGVSIEFIDWSDLPSQDPSYWPSKYLFRLEVMIAIFDCLHRARYNAKYVAQTDLDELVIVKTNGTLVDLMNSYAEKHPEMSSVSLVSRRAKFKPEFENVSSPLELDFNLLSEVNAESYYFPRPLYSKLIHRPERIFKGHIHKQIGAEQPPNSTDSRAQYKLIDMPNSKAYILHLRRVIGSNFKLRLFSPTEILKDEAAEWQRNYSDRLQKHKFPSIQWQNGLDVLKKIESCRQGHERRRLKECHAIYDCTRDINTTNWFQAPNKWTHLY